MCDFIILKKKKRQPRKHESPSSWLAICEENSAVAGRFPSQNLVMQKPFPCPLVCRTNSYGRVNTVFHDDVIKWKHFPRYWPFMREIHQSPVNFPHKGQWRGALMFALICVWINGWVNNREAGDLRRYRVHYDVIVMCWFLTTAS